MGITSESDHTYYDADKNEVEERDAKGTYYSKEGDTKRYTEDEAYEGQAKYKSYASYNQPAYPTKMQREYIWGIHSKTSRDQDHQDPSRSKRSS